MSSPDKVVMHNSVDIFRYVGSEYPHHGFYQYLRVIFIKDGFHEPGKIAVVVFGYLPVFSSHHFFQIRSLGHLLVTQGRQLIPFLGKFPGHCFCGVIQGRCGFQ